MIAEAIDGSVEMILLDPALTELLDVLGRKLGFASGECDEVKALMDDIAIATALAPDGPVAPVTGDPDDDVILATAVAAEVSVLISGDRKHLLPLGEYAGVRILTPQAFLAELRA